MHETFLIINELLEKSKREHFVRESSCFDIIEEYISEINNNRKFISQLIEDSISNIAFGRPHKLITSQQILLGQNKNLVLRMNIWPTLEDRAEHTKSELSLYSYNDAHDHNFTFITIGHYGPGYHTSIYTYDRDSIRGLPGESVQLKFDQDVQLERGKKLWFISGKHVHVQSVPSSISASINAIIKDPVESSKPQFYFDLKKGEILRLTDNVISKQANFLELCSLFNDELCRDLIRFYADKSPSLYLRDFAGGLKNG